MASETDRYRLFEWFEAHMGPDLTPTMIESLPPVNWTDVATKSDLGLLRADLDVFGAEMRSEIANVRAEISASEARLLGQNRTLFLGTLASNATLVGLIVAVLRLSG